MFGSRSTNWTSASSPVARRVSGFVLTNPEVREVSGFVLTNPEPKKDLHGLNIDEPLAMLRSGATSYYEADGLGSITSLSNSSGSIVQTYNYYGVTSFGTHSSSGSITNPFRFTGREYDETGLYFYRARYYDPQSGRFLSEDPIGFNGGEDFYSYAYNNSVNLTDPEGFQARDYTRKYKCSLFGGCTRNHPLGGKTYKPPKPCPLVGKEFDAYERCFDDRWLENLPGSWTKTQMEKNRELHVPHSHHEEPEIPGVGIGDVINTAGEAAEAAMLECFKEHPLAGLDPRFPPQLDIGKMSKPNWWNKVTNFLGWDSPVF